MGALEFPCEKCGKAFLYQDLVNHRCVAATGKSILNKQIKTKFKINGNSVADDVEIIDVEDGVPHSSAELLPSKKRKFQSLGLNMWSGQSSSKKTSKRKPLTKSNRYSTSPISSKAPLFSNNDDSDNNCDDNASDVLFVSESSSKPKISAKEGAKQLGLNMHWKSSKTTTQKGGLHHDNQEDDDGAEVPEMDEGNFTPTNLSKYYDRLDYLLDEKTVEVKKLKYDTNFPLSEVLRPKTLDDYVGHSDIVGEDGIIRKFIYTGVVPSMIFWGEPGVGKTTLVRLILTEIKNSAFSKYYKINELSAVSSNLAELKAMYEKFKKLKRFNAEMKMILFLDEIHRFSKLQQDFFLSLIENNEMIFFGCTTENPSYKVNDAMLSRCQIFNLQRASASDILAVVNKGLLYINKSRILLYKKKPLIITKEAKSYLAQICDGDYRTALNLLETIATSYPDNLGEMDQKALLKESQSSTESVDVIKKETSIISSNPKRICIDIDHLKNFLQHTIIGSNSKIQVEDLFSALYKSVVGSDANAAIIYLAYIFETKPDPLEIANFLHSILVNEIDESDNHNNQINHVSLLEFSNTAYYVVTKLGLPECDLALIQFTYLLCQARKSRKITKTAERLEDFFDKNPTALLLSIPMHIRNAPTEMMKDLGYSDGYKYNPDYIDGQVKQYYLPRGIRKTTFAESEHYGHLEDESLGEAKKKQEVKLETESLISQLYDTVEEAESKK